LNIEQRIRSISLIIFVFFFSWLVNSPLTFAQAENGSTIQTNELDADGYPREVTFRLVLDTAVPVTNATLSYEVNKFSCLEATATVPVEVEGSSLEWTWEMVRSGNPPPGTSVAWFWTITDSNGQTMTTDRQTYTFSDGRYDWRTVQADNLKLHWYESDVGPTLLDASVEGLDRLESEMGIELQDEVNIFIYGDTDDMRDAVLYIQDWAGGVAFTEYNVILMGVPPRLADTWGRDVVPHELAHLVVAQFGRSCLGGDRPTWLDEGLAVYAEGEPSQDILDDIENGVQNDSFEPLRSLNGAFSAHGPEAGISYSQSYSVVDYLLRTYGREQMQQLILTLAQGKGTDEALEMVYGFNIDGLEQEWRAALGANPRDIPPTPTPLSAANIPTVVPLGLPGNVPTPPAAAATAALNGSEGADPQGNEAANNNPGICNLGLVPLLLLGFFFNQQQRRRK